jgi:hypothetical protein
VPVQQPSRASPAKRTRASRQSHCPRFPADQRVLGHSGHVWTLTSFTYSRAVTRLAPYVERKLSDDARWTL